MWTFSHQTPEYFSIRPVCLRVPNFYIFCTTKSKTIFFSTPSSSFDRSAKNRHTNKIGSHVAPCGLARPPAYAMRMLAPTLMQESTLSHNEFSLYLRSLLRPSSVLSACEFATYMGALIPSPVPACLPLFLRPSLTLYPSEFESLYMRALTPTHVHAVFRQSGSRPGQPVWPTTGLTTRVFRRPLLLSTPHVKEYSNDIVFLFHPSHLSHHLPAPLPDNFIMIVIVVSVWIVVFM